MNLERLIEEAKELADWLAGQLDGLNLPGHRRAHLAGACLSVALGHHCGIITLLEHRHNPSAIALLRPLVESYVRGSWLAFAATDEQVEGFGKGREPPQIGDMIEALERHERFNAGVLSDVKRQTWKALCDFTHTGVRQLVRNMTADSIEMVYEEEELIGALGAADGYALLVATSLAGIAGNEDLSKRLLERARGCAGGQALTGQPV